MHNDYKSYSTIKPLHNVFVWNGLKVKVANSGLHIEVLDYGKVYTLEYFRRRFA